MKGKLCFKVYNKENKLAAEIVKHESEDYSIQRYEKVLPALIQKEKLNNSEINIFLKTRVLPYSRSEVSQKATLEDLIKLNSGRVYSDDFYILIEKDGKILAPLSSYCGLTELEGITVEDESEDII